MSLNKVAVIGLGYIGLPTATMFANHGKEVLGVDVKQDVVQLINQGGIHIVEPFLEEQVKKAVDSGGLRASLEVEPSDAFIIAVPTPFKSNHEADLSFVKKACQLIAPVLKSGNLVILESTAPVGATEQMRDWLLEFRPELSFAGVSGGSPVDIHVAHCPERVLPGKVMKELIENDRIIGGATAECSRLSVELYRSFVKGECLITSMRTAEMAKLTENSFRDVNIAFANELSMICEEQGIDVWELIGLANRHPRVNILNPGCGVGGHCIAVDPWFIVSSNPEKAKLIKQAREVNDNKPDWVVEKILLQARENETNSVVCMGISFKPDIDDLRESPAIEVVRKLIRNDLSVSIVEPNIERLPDELESLGCKLTSLDEIHTHSKEVVAILVSHTQFRSWLQQAQRNNVLDFCGVR